jgi:hypothetical protein
MSVAARHAVQSEMCSMRTSFWSRTGKFWEQHEACEWRLVCSVFSWTTSSSTYSPYAMTWRHVSVHRNLRQLLDVSPQLHVKVALFLKKKFRFLQEENSSLRISCGYLWGVIKVVWHIFRRYGRKCCLSFQVEEKYKQSQSHITTDGQSVSISWCWAQSGTFD